MAGRVRIEMVVLVAGALALATAPFLPVVGRARPVECGWTCYSPLHHEPTRHLSLWSLAPGLAITLLCAAAITVAVGFAGRGWRARLIGAAVVGVAAVALGVIARQRAGYDFVVVDDAGRLDVARTSWWVVLPVVGGVAAIAALLRAAQRET